jgi:hypothetical protein
MNEKTVSDESGRTVASKNDELVGLFEGDVDHVGLGRQTGRLALGEVGVLEEQIATVEGITKNERVRPGRRRGRSARVRTLTGTRPS